MSQIKEETSIINKRSNLTTGDPYEIFEYIENVKQTLDQNKLTNRDAGGQFVHYPLGWLYAAAKYFRFPPQSALTRDDGIFRLDNMQREDYMFNSEHLLNSYGYDENHLPWNEVQGFDPNEPMILQLVSILGQKISWNDPELRNAYDNMSRLPSEFIIPAMQMMSKIMQLLSSEPVIIDSIGLNYAAPVEALQQIMANFGNHLLTNSDKIKRQYKELADKHYMNRQAVIEAMPKIRGLVAMMDIIKKQPDGTATRETIESVLQSIMTREVLTNVSEVEKACIIHLRKIYHAGYISRQRNILIFWTALRECYEESAVATIGQPQHALAAYTSEPRKNPFQGKAGQQDQKRKKPRLPDDTVITAKMFNDMMAQFGQLKGAIARANSGQENQNSNKKQKAHNEQANTARPKAKKTKPIKDESLDSSGDEDGEHAAIAKVHTKDTLEKVLSSETQYFDYAFAAHESYGSEDTPEFTCNGTETTQSGAIIIEDDYMGVSVITERPATKKLTEFVQGMKEPYLITTHATECNPVGEISFISDVRESLMNEKSQDDTVNNTTTMMNNQNTTSAGLLDHMARLSGPYPTEAKRFSESSVSQPTVINNHSNDYTLADLNADIQDEDRSVEEDFDEDKLTTIFVNARMWDVALSDLDRFRWSEIATIDRSQTWIRPSIIQRIDNGFRQIVNKLKRRLNEAVTNEEIIFYADAIRDVLKTSKFTSQPDIDEVDLLVSDRQKAVHPYPYISSTLRLANFEESVWNQTKPFDQMGYFYRDRVQELESKLEQLHPTKYERTWIAQHAAWLWDSAWNSDTVPNSCEYPIIYRIAAYEECIARKLHELPCRNPEFLPVDQVPLNMARDVERYGGLIKRFGCHITVPPPFKFNDHFRVVTNRNGKTTTEYTELGYQKKAEMAGWNVNDGTQRVTRLQSRRANLVYPEPVLPHSDTDDKDPMPSNPGSTDDQA
jgi:hypothetical protein